MIELIKAGMLDNVDRSKFYTDTDNFALIDADSMLYYCLKEGITFEEAKIKLDMFMFKTLEKLKTPIFAALITPRATFRQKIGITKKYKGNRKGRKTPPIFYGLKAYAKDEWGFYEVPGLEADDCMGLYQDDHSIICSPDKDVIKQIPGKHWNYGKREWITTSEDDAWEFLWTQALMGDSTDQIPGIKGVGLKTAEKTLIDVRKEDFPLRILQMYIEHNMKESGVKISVDKFKETLDLVYILRTKEELDRYGIKLPEVQKSDIRERYAT